jgi:hypothetical protein
MVHNIFKFVKDFFSLHDKEFLAVVRSKKERYLLEDGLEIAEAYEKWMLADCPVTGEIYTNYVKLLARKNYDVMLIEEQKEDARLREIIRDEFKKLAKNKK